MLQKPCHEVGRARGYELEFRLVEREHVQQLQPQRLEPFALGEDVVCRVHLFVGREHLTAQQVSIADDGGHRRFHLVREVGHEPLLQRHALLNAVDVALKLPGHAVEVGRELPHLVARAHGRPVAEIAPRQFPRRAGKRAERAR